MTVLQLPVSSDLKDYSFRIQLDDAFFVLRFRWNDRTKAWFMDVSDDGDNLIISGRRLVVGEALLWRNHYLNACPKGEIVAFDTTNLDQDPGLDDLGTRVLIFYYDQSEGLP